MRNLTQKCASNEDTLNVVADAKAKAGSLSFGFSDTGSGVASGCELTQKYLPS